MSLPRRGARGQRCLGAIAYSEILTTLQEAEEISSQSLEVSRNNSQDVSSGISLGSLAIDRPLHGQATQSQDMLMHTLLERDARHQVIEQRRKAGQSLNGKYRRPEAIHPTNNSQSLSLPWLRAEGWTLLTQYAFSEILANCAI